MLRFAATLRRTSLTLVAVSAIAGCGSDSPAGPATLAGTYRATVMRVTPTGQAARDLLAQGGTLNVTIAADNTTSGSLNLPPEASGGSAFTASMAGTVVRTGNTIEFQQSADSFVRDLTWTVGNNALTVVDQTAGGARFTITLTRQ